MKIMQELLVYKVQHGQYQFFKESWQLFAFKWSCQRKEFSIIIDNKFEFKNENTYEKLSLKLIQEVFMNFR